MKIVKSNCTAIKIITIEEKVLSMSGPGRTTYRFSIITGNFGQVRAYFQTVPPPQAWMRDVCLVACDNDYTRTGFFTDVGGSASDIKVGDVFKLN